ncbi:hypothetical protein HME9302_02262 [Alteripontixanthobacter maritimus]|uniref:Thioesterase domain-containing protein n=1 Tax=Alteripontixanthobacter maritimus TaxID=2161824 RepID=A0A369QBU6_9SPHN|nr:thioesterase family protein [Alteripontixanthobacter maritimus]RDC61045.1 hypothetical protein HME9302_02262 [Alteripontixanthobacter maritimus]
MSDAPNNHTASPFTTEFAVRYAELDPQNVVFNSRYLEYSDVVISEYWRALGLSGPDAPDLQFHIRHAGVDFLAPLRGGDVVRGTAQIARLGNSSLTIRVTLREARDDAAAAPRATIDLTMVHVDLASGRPTPVPDHARKAFGNELARQQDISA